MGRRLRTMWRLRDPERAPRGARGAGAGARAAARARTSRTSSPWWCVPGEQRDRDELVAALVGAGYRREEVVEHRGEVAVRGSIIDVYPSTADRPVRIDLWGDEVDRLTEFSVGRPALHRRPRPTSRSSAAASCCPPPRCASGPSALIALEPWGREQWERLAEGQTFDGMERWLPWLTEGEHVLFDLVGPDALVLLLEPRRMRDRAADLLAEEADLAATPRQDLGRDGGRRGRRASRGCTCPFDRLLAHTDAPAWTVTTAPEGPDVATVASMGDRGHGRRPRAGRAPARRAGRRRLPDRRGRRRRGLGGPPAVAAVRATASRPTIDVSPLERGCILPGHQAGGDRRARPHRSPAGPPRGPPAPPRRRRASSTTSSPATTSCTTSTASPATAAW